MNRNTIWTLLAVSALATVVAGTVLSQQARPDASAVAASPPLLEFLASDVIQVQTGELRQLLPMTGTLRAINQASVKARVGGDVREVLVREGEAVKAGQVLARMDVRDYQSRVDQARGALQAARGQMEIAAKARDNNQALLDKGFISRNAFDNAQSQYSIARANVESAQAAHEVARKALDDTVIRAPIAGLISSRTVQPGEKVSPDNRLLEVVDLSQMELEAAVPASEITRVSLDQDVQVKVQGADKSFSGKVARINPSTQAGSRSILVYIRISNPEGALRAGMFGEAQLTLERKTGILTLPHAAIRGEDGVTFVYAIENSTLVQKPVTLGLRGADSGGGAVEVISGVDVGDQVLRTNMGAVRTGSIVRFMPTGATTATNAPLLPARTE
jgi:membrane fusion protein, multidrug efflux system